MKQFNLEEYMKRVAEGETPEIVTRNGCKARIICTDRVHRFYPIIALVYDPDDEYEGVISYTTEGIMSVRDDKTAWDLFFAPRKKTIKGWVNVYTCGFGEIYMSEKAAHAVKRGETYIKTIEISTEIEEE